MVGMSRHAPHAVTTAMPRMDWFALLRGLECLSPDRPRIGHGVRPGDEPVRLHHAMSLGFAPDAIDGLEADDRGYTQIRSHHLGLWGPNGALPLHLTEYALERHRTHRDDTLGAFADIFHHRVLAQFYRAWAQAQPCVQADRNSDDGFKAFIGAFIGVDGVDGEDGTLPGPFLRFMAGHLVNRSRHAEGLENMLSTLFRMPVQVETQMPGYLCLEAEDLLRLGHPAARLGIATTCGDRVPHATGHVRLHLGPMDMDTYVQLLPGHEGRRLLVAMVWCYAGGECRWDAQMSLCAGAAPAPVLGIQGHLGWTLWLGGAPTDRDVAALQITPATTRTYS